MDAVLFGDIEAQAIAYLQAALDARSEAYTADVTVSDTYRGADPARQVVVTRDGGPRLNIVQEQPRLRTNVWAATDADATDLALMVCALYAAWPNGMPVSKTRQLSGPSRIDEPNGRSRRVLLVEATVRGAQLVA